MPLHTFSFFTRYHIQDVMFNSLFSSLFLLRLPFKHFFEIQNCYLVVDLGYRSVTLRVQDLIYSLVLLLTVKSRGHFVDVTSIPGPSIIAFLLESHERPKRVPCPLLLWAKHLFRIVVAWEPIGIPNTVVTIFLSQAIAFRLKLIKFVNV